MSKPTIVFDLGGVLLDWDRRHLYGKLFNGRAAELDYFLNNVCTLPWNEQMDAGRPFADAIAEKTAQFPDYEPYIAAYQSRWPEMIAGAIEGTVAVLRELRQAGYATAALSNWPPDTFPLVKQRFDFLNGFDPIILSSEHKVVKPDPPIYQILLEQIDREPHDCIFIDNLSANTEAAAKLGFRVIHFKSPNQLRADLNKLNVL